jgi:putative endonuclease
MVAEWYRREGYEIVEQNWRVRAGEVDLIARHDTVFVFCEVKTRRRSDFGVPAFAVNRDKQRRLRRLAARYLADHPVRGAHVRFDVAEVVGTTDAYTINVIKAAF